jgi:hypothetical protein
MWSLIKRVENLNLIYIKYQIVLSNLIGSLDLLIFIKHKPKMG